MTRVALDNQPIANKVTLIFWLIKMMSTTVGKTVANLLMVTRWQNTMDRDSAP